MEKTRNFEDPIIRCASILDSYRKSCKNGNGKAENGENLVKIARNEFGLPYPNTELIYLNQIVYEGLK